MVYIPSFHSPRRLLEDDPELERHEVATLVLEIEKLQLKHYEFEKVDPLKAAPEVVVGTKAELYSRYSETEKHLRYFSGFITKPYSEFVGEDFLNLRSALYLRHHVLQHFDAMNELLDETVDAVFAELDQATAKLSDDETPYTTPFAVPLFTLLPDPVKTLQNILDIYLGNRVQEVGLLKHDPGIIHENICRISKLPVSDYAGYYVENQKKYVFPAKCDLPISKMFEAYLSGSHAYEMFRRLVPLPWTDKLRFRHTHILGNWGAGKTTLLERIIFNDLRQHSRSDSKVRRSIILIDPHSNIIEKLKYNSIGVTGRRHVIIDPRDLEYPVAINLFAVNKKRMATYDAATREQLTIGVLETFDYFFSGLPGAEMTAKQSVAFRYLVQLLLTFPTTMGRNATLFDMFDLTNDATPYMSAIERLDAMSRSFFSEYIDPKNSNWRDTKEQIRNRLHMALTHPVLKRFFNSQENKLDFFEEMNRGSIILIDTAQGYLHDAHGVLGRLFISLCYRAILERAAIDEEDRVPTFLYVDEAASYFDASIEKLLTDARKFKCACTFAHHFLHQASDKLRASLAGTGIKFVGKPSAADARAMAADMRTNPEFLLAQPDFTFAAYLSGVTTHAINIEAPPSPLSDESNWLSEEQYQERMWMNRVRISSLTTRKAAPAPDIGPAPSPHTPDNDISKEW